MAQFRTLIAEMLSKTAQKLRFVHSLRKTVQIFLFNLHKL